MKKAIISLCVSMFVLLGLPLLAAKFAGTNGMAFCFIMFYVINPIYFILLGIRSGRNIKKLWYMSITTATIYLLSMWILFEPGELAFVMYAIVYIIISAIAMLITAAVKNRKI